MPLVRSAPEARTNAPRSGQGRPSSRLGNLHAARAVGGYDRRFQQYARVAVLVVDDFGLKPLRPPHDEDFHDLVAERYERATTILTSNLDFEEWGAAFPANKMLGAATIDRLRHGAYRVTLDGDSYRDPRPLPEPEKQRAESTPKSALAKAPKNS